MTSTLQHSVNMLQSFGFDIDPDQCDAEALRADARDIRAGILPLHLSHLPTCPPASAAELLDTVAAILAS
jgi:hypothetical protein